MKSLLLRVGLAIAALTSVIVVGKAMAAGDGRFHVSGRTVTGPDGQAVVLRGVNKSGLEYTAWGYDLDLATFQRIKSWGANVVRLPLTPAFALQGMCKYKAEYMTNIDKVVALAEQLKMLLILSDHFGTKGTTCGVTKDWHGNQKAPDSYNLQFVKALGARYKNRPYVAIDLYNEPHDISWDIWRKGGRVDAYTAVGMQALLDGVRSSGFTGLVFASGNAWANDLSVIANEPLKNDKDVVYAAHVYPEMCGTATVPDNVPYSCQGKSYQPVYDNWVAPAIAKRAVMVTEFGTKRNFASDTQAAIDWMTAKGVGWTTWLWCNTKTSDFCVMNPDFSPSPTGLPVYTALQPPVPPTTTTSSTTPSTTSTSTTSTTVPESTTTTGVPETTTTTESTTTTSTSTTSTSTTSTTVKPTTTTFKPTTTTTAKPVTTTSTSTTSTTRPRTPYML